MNETMKEIYTAWLNQIESKLGDVDATPETTSAYEQVVLMVKQLKWSIRDGEKLPIRIWNEDTQQYI